MRLPRNMTQTVKPGVNQQGRTEIEFHLCPKKDLSCGIPVAKGRL